MRTGHTGRAAAALILPTLGLALLSPSEPSTAATPAAPASAVGPGGADPFDVVHTATYRGGRVTETASTPLGADAFDRTDPGPKSVPETPPPRPRKVSEPLERLVAADGAGHAELLVTFDDPIAVPRFPEPETREDRDGPTNRRRLAEATALVAGLEQRRAGLYADQTALLTGLGGRVLETFWLIQAVRVDLPLAAVTTLAARDDVRHVEQARDGEAPPDDGNPLNDVIDARDQVHSDPYFALGLTSAWIGLLDTGVRESHDMLLQPDHLDFVEDLTGDGDPGDQCNHGTSSAALITGNANLGADWRGLTAFQVDSWDVYGNDCKSDTATVVGALQTAVLTLDKVIVVEVQNGGDVDGALCTAADAAFDAGAVVIAPNGNFGKEGAGSVRAPAMAHKALGIGAADLRTDVITSGSGRGPTSDQRYKPDVVLPTNIETAFAGSDPSMGVFTGTSAATAVAGGAIALMRAWMLTAAPTVDPGQVYSLAVLSGRRAYPFDNTLGAGPFELKVDGRSWWGKVALDASGTVEVPLQVRAGPTRLEAALWWPEGVDDHSDLDLALIAPDGTVMDTSTSVWSVFEKASVLQPPDPGTWTLRITGYSIDDVQTVYWSAAVS